MAYTSASQTSTAVGSALSSNASGAWLSIAANDHAIVRIDAASVTTGAVVTIEGRMQGAGSEQTARSAVVPLASFTIAANGVTVFPLRQALPGGAKVPDEIRATVSSRTDGTYTTTYLTHAQV